MNDDKHKSAFDSVAQPAPADVLQAETARIEKELAALEERAANVRRLQVEEANGEAEAKNRGDRKAAAEAKHRRESIDGILGSLEKDLKEKRAALRKVKATAGISTVVTWFFVTSLGKYFRLLPPGSRDILSPAHSEDGYEKWRDDFIKELIESGHDPEDAAASIILKTVESKEPIYGSTDEVVIRQGGKVLNLYRPPTLAPVPGDWDPIRRVILNLCGGKEANVEWVLDWITTVVQAQRRGQPVKMGLALCFFGTPKGAGKNTFGEVLHALLGCHNVLEIGQGALDAPYNGWAENKLLFICNEVFSSENRSKATTNKLKTWIAEERRLINEKFIPAYTIFTKDNFIFFSNDLRPVVVERGDRRFAVFQVAGKIDRALGKQVSEDARKGGPTVQAFLDHLLTRSSKVQPFSDPPDTRERKELMTASLDSAEKFSAEIQEHGFHSVTGPWENEKICAAQMLDRNAAPLAPSYFVERDGVRWITNEVLTEVYRAWCSALGYQALGEIGLRRTLRDAVRRPRGEELLEKVLKIRGRSARCFGDLPGVGPETLAVIEGGKPKPKVGLHFAAEGT